MFCKKSVLRNFAKLAKLTGKHLCHSLFFNSVAGLRPANLLKKRLWHRRFAVSFVKFLRTPFFIEHLWMAAYEVSLSIDLRFTGFYEINPSKKVCFICLHESPLNMTKNAFYFILKALFVLDIYIFVWTFWSFRKNGMIRKIRLILKFMTSKAG